MDQAEYYLYKYDLSGLSFVPISGSYVHHFLGFAWCPLLCFSWTELCLARLFGLSVLVYFQSHGFLCSGQLQIFPVYLFLWNPHHSCDYKLQLSFQCFFRHIYCYAGVKV